MKQKLNPIDAIFNKTQTGTAEGTINKNKITMLCTWIFELMLHSIVSLELSVYTIDPNTSININTNTNTSSNTSSNTNTSTNKNVSLMSNPLTSSTPTKNLPLKISPNAEEKFRIAKETSRLSQVSIIKDFLRKHKYALIFLPIFLIFNLHHNMI